MSLNLQPILPLARPDLDHLPKALRPKLLRLNFGDRLRVVDLFSGCGGWSCGFEAAGPFVSVAAVEKNPVALKSHQRNFGRSERYYRALGAIETVRPVDLAGHLDGPVEQAIDIIIGSPPCQPFSRVGRAKLRSLASEQTLEAVYGDERVGLVAHYLRLLEVLQPLAFAIENVNDYTRFKHRNVAEEVAVTAEGLGYRCQYTHLNAVWYGVPQLRERVIILGVHESLGVEPSFPKPTCRYDIPEGYATSRAHRKLLGGTVLEPADHFVTVSPPRQAKRAISTEVALSDLPFRPGYREGRFEPEREFEYREELPQSTYQKLMRQWPGFEALPFNKVADHRTRTLNRDYETFARMQPDDRYNKAIHIAEKRFQEARTRQEAELGRPLGDDELESLRTQIVPPYPVHKFKDKWQKLNGGKPSHTLPAHLAHDCYSHIHYDSAQARTITIREAARLQSFPDGFRFEGGMNDAYRQIGNAVPPLLARAIAEELLKTLQKALPGRALEED